MMSPMPLESMKSNPLRSSSSRFAPVSSMSASIDETGTKRLLLDLSGLDFMDSSGIGLIIGRYTRMKRRGGSVEVVGSNPRIDRIFDMAGLYQLVGRASRGRV